MVILSVNIQSGAVTKVSQDLDVSWHLLSVKNGLVVAAVEGFTKPPSLILANAGDWDWQEAMSSINAGMPEQVETTINKLSHTLLKLKPSTDPRGIPFEAMVISRIDAKGNFSASVAISPMEVFHNIHCGAAGCFCVVASNSWEWSILSQSQGLMLQIPVFYCLHVCPKCDCSFGSLIPLGLSFLDGRPSIHCVIAAGPQPTILRVHGGPHSAFSHIFSPNLIFYTALGYTLILVNYRGSTAYGEASVQSLPGRIGANDVSDCMVALDACIERGAYTCTQTCRAISTPGNNSVLY